jgi:putative ABC transport system permease protein
MIGNETFRLAIQALRVNRVRALLTILGVSIGSASIVLVITISMVAQHYVLALIEGVGSNLVYAYLSGENRPMADEISYSDLLAARNMPDVKQAAGTNDIGRFLIVINGKEVPVTVIGVTEGFQQIRNLVILQGRYFDDIDMQSAAKACVISEEMAKRYPQDTIGNVLKLSEMQCTIIGVFRERVSTFGQSEIRPESVLIPFSLMKYYLGRDYLRTIYVQADSPAAVPLVDQELKRLLASRHRASVDYTVENLASVLAVAKRIGIAFGIVLFLLAVVTLSISGVGIMNIMLVSVTERTREIGVRKAIGATQKEIRAQFLIEALIMSGLGALLGIAVALFCEALVQSIVGPKFGIHIPIAGASLIAALVLSFGAGILFGYIPAIRASKLEPMESLRYE